VTLGVFVWWLRTDSLQMARNMAFSTLVFGELFRAFAARSWDQPFWRASSPSNILLLGVVGLSVLAQLGLHHIPFAQTLFDIGTISLRDCLVSIALGLLPLTILELRKVVRARSAA
jgi:Ca2+-transporting ATPase